MYWAGLPPAVVKLPPAYTSLPDVVSAEMEGGLPGSAGLPIPDPRPVHVLPFHLATPEAKREKLPVFVTYVNSPPTYKSLPKTASDWTKSSAPEPNADHA